MDLRPYLQFNRKLSSRVTVFLGKVPVSPNHVTSLALLLGVLSGFCMSYGNRWSMVAGAFWLHLSFIFDNCDGELARMRQKRTVFGKWYDLIADLLVDYALWVGLFFGTLRQGFGGPVFVILLMACAGSLLNFMMVIWERKKGCSTSIHQLNQKQDLKRQSSTFHSILDTLAHNGDSVMLVWVFSLIGNPWYFLMAAAVFINALWFGRFLSNTKQLFAAGVVSCD
jgi:phosphatidylglycerophosphate synthase